MEPNRTLTDADVESIVSALEKRLKKGFYEDLGKGAWGFIWKGLLGILFSIAAYGGLKSL